jgi:hypothetical protein
MLGTISKQLSHVLKFFLFLILLLVALVAIASLFLSLFVGVNSKNLFIRGLGYIGYAEIILLFGYSGFLNLKAIRKRWKQRQNDRRETEERYQRWKKEYGEN